MDGQEDDVFESAEKTDAYETVNIQPTTYISLKSNKRANKTGQSVSWKYTNITNYSTISREKQRRSANCQNISFEQQTCFAKNHRRKQHTDEIEQQQEPSSFLNHYSGTQQIYKKIYNFGTSWIAQKQYFSSVFIKPQNIQKNSLQYYIPGNVPEEDQVDLSLKGSFDSQFQSGNLFTVYRLGKFEYDLILQNDINTKGNTQWFYFRINNPPKNRNIKINIVNMRKPDSLFNYGMKPCIFSVGEWKSNKKGWFRGGNHIKYFRNNHLVQGSCNYYYTLTFTISTAFENDVLRVAQNYPYTTQDLTNYLQKIGRIKYKNQLIQKQTITNTIGKNKIQCLTIKQNSKIKNRPIILILARQHPGQTLSSYICEGIIDFFLIKTKQSQYLRKNYQIKVVPMVNPDGVAAGNYRTNLFGCDLNRKWQGTKSHAPQQASLIKKYILENTKDKNISFILDLHGHSRKLFSFFYGNPSTQSSIHTRIFPYLCSKLAPNLIRFQDCVFSSQSYKRNTARVQLNNSFKSLNIFTFEASFFGYIDKNGEKKHFTIEGYRQLGSILGRAIYAYEKGKEMIQIKLEKGQTNLYLKSINELTNSKNLDSFGQKDDSGSDSSPQACQLKQSQQFKLYQNQQYGLLRQKGGKRPTRVLKKVLNRERQSQSSNRSYKPMQFLEVAQVNSIFPQNNMALIPDSLLAKKQKQKHQNKMNFGVQTEFAIELYQIGEKEHLEHAFIDPYRSQIFTKSEVKFQLEQKKKQAAQNRLKSNAFFPSKNELLNNILFNTNGFRSLSQRKEYQIKKKNNDSIQRITGFDSFHNSPHKKYKKEMGSQTLICLLNGQKIEDQIRNTSSSDVKPLQQVDRSYLMYYNTIRSIKPRGKSSRFATLNQILNKTSLNVQ